MNFRHLLSNDRPPVLGPWSLTDQLRAILIDNQTKAVLFADDDPNLRTMIEFLPTVLQMDLTTVASCVELRAALDVRHFDIIILDYYLSNGESADIYREQLSRRPGCQVVFITGGSLDEVSLKVHQAGPAPVYPKPIAFALPFLVHLLSQMGVEPRRPIGATIRDDQAVAAGTV